MGLMTPHGLTNYLCDHNFDLREGWGVRQSFATPTRFELPKHVVALKKLLTRQLKDMLTGMLTHGLTPCIIYHDQNDYASLRNPVFCLRQTAIRYDTTLTKQMKGGFGPSSHDFPRNLHSPRFSSIDKGYFEPATKTHGTHGDFTIPQQR